MTRTCRLKTDRSSLCGRRQSNPGRNITLISECIVAAVLTPMSSMAANVGSARNGILVQKYRDGLFVGANPTDELITSGLPVVRPQSDASVHSPVPRRSASLAVKFCHSVARRVSNSSEETQP
jgi:hypothetical protein